MHPNSFFPFLEFSLGLSTNLPQVFSGSRLNEDWVELHRWAVQQSLVGPLYAGISRLPEVSRPPRGLVMRWAMEAEHVRGLNRLVNEVSARLTSFFDRAGARSCILKGAANALCYPDSGLRQTGDVDIWVEGGKKRVLALLKSLKLMKGATVSTLHVHLDDSLFGVVVEVHFAPTIQYAPLENRNLQNFLSSEVFHCHFNPVEFADGTVGGFYVPCFRYALVMQLGHIKQHLFGSGLGLRQLVDYRMLLQAASDEDRKEVSKQLRYCGLTKMASAVMWVLQEVLGLEDFQMLCKPNRRRGEFLLKVALCGGNFGWYAEDFNQSVIMRWFKDRVRFFRLLSFDFTESIWREMRYWVKTVSLIPRRIRRCRLALGKR